jgi:hypothetical protein
VADQVDDRIDLPDRGHGLLLSATSSSQRARTHRATTIYGAI